MHSNRGLFTAAIITLIVGLVVLFPARVAYHWLAPAAFPVSGITGTVWRGSADAADANGVLLRNVSWRFQPLRLYTGSLVYKIDGAPADGFIEGDIFVSIGRSVTVSGDNIRASLPLRMFEKALNVPGLRGNSSLQLERLELRDGMPVELDGILDIANLVVPVVNGGSIGGYRIEFFTAADGISASLEDTDGVLDIAGSLQLKRDRSYQLLAQVVAKATAPTVLRNRIERLPAANDRGQRELRVEGSL
jgi:general secretion pathway protein N